MGSILFDQFIKGAKGQSNVKKKEEEKVIFVGWFFNC